MKSYLGSFLYRTASARFERQEPPAQWLYYEEAGYIFTVSDTNCHSDKLILRSSRQFELSFLPSASFSRGWKLVRNFSQNFEENLSEGFQFTVTQNEQPPPTQFYVKIEYFSSIQLHLLQRSGMRGTIPPLLRYVFMAWCSVTYRGSFAFTYCKSTN